MEAVACPQIPSNGLGDIVPAAISNFRLLRQRYRVFACRCDSFHFPGEIPRSLYLNGSGLPLIHLFQRALELPISDPFLPYGPT